MARDGARQGDRRGGAEGAGVPPWRESKEAAWVVGGNTEGNITACRHLSRHCKGTPALHSRTEPGVRKDRFGAKKEVGSELGQCQS